MKKYVTAGMLGMILVWSYLIWDPVTAIAAITNSVVYKLSVTIPEHIQTNAAPQAPDQLSELPKGELQESTTQEAVRDHERVILQTIVMK